MNSSDGISYPHCPKLVDDGPHPIQIEHENQSPERPPHPPFFGLFFPRGLVTPVAYEPSFQTEGAKESQGLWSSRFGEARN